MDISTYKITEQFKTGTSERAELVKGFLAILNKEREGTRYKPLKASMVACKLSHISLSELYYFKKTCDNATSFSRCFFGLLKVK